LAARFVRDEEAAGSNPATPTKKRQVGARFQVPGAWLIDRLPMVDIGIERHHADMTVPRRAFGGVWRYLPRRRKADFRILARA
jgi:hypothetical protein